MKEKIFTVIVTLAVFTAVFCACGNKENEEVPVTAHISATSTPTPAETPATVTPAAETPEPEPTAAPTVMPTTAPTVAPTAAPTPEPTITPEEAERIAAEAAAAEEAAAAQAASTELIPGINVTQSNVDNYCTTYGADGVYLNAPDGKIYTIGASWAPNGWAGKIQEGADFTLNALNVRIKGDERPMDIFGNIAGTTAVLPEMLDLVNADRAANGADPLVWNSEMEGLAMIRAQEYVTEYANGTPHQGLYDRGYVWNENGDKFSENAYSIIGIELSETYGGSTFKLAEEGNNGWIESTGHHNNRINTEYNTYCAAIIGL